MVKIVIDLTESGRNVVQKVYLSSLTNEEIIRDFCITNEISREMFINGYAIQTFDINDKPKTFTQ
jgi:hypothetical protein